jgi:hypothetical protein
MKEPIVQTLSPNNNEKEQLNAILASLLLTKCKELFLFVDY